jgi:hypothetical protein
MYIRTEEGLGWGVPIYSPAKIYNRNAAIDYARRHWNIPCNDNFIALHGDPVKVSVGTKFVHEFNPEGQPLPREHALKPDGTRIEWEDLNDCTHYISCCIGQPPGDTAGGIPITFRQHGSPPTDPYGITRVSTMVDYLLGRMPKRPTKYADIIGTEKTNSNLIKNLDPGDLIAYLNIKKGIYSHLTLYLGNDKIACHTYCRFDDPACTWDKNWALGIGPPRTHLWTFLHIFV